MEESRGATVSRSRELADGSWETIELSVLQQGTEALATSVGTGTLDVQLAAALAQELDAAILAMFKVHDRAKAKAYKELKARLDQEEAEEADLPDPWVKGPPARHTTTCPEHGVVWQTHRKEGSAWRSHLLPGGAWCRDRGDHTKPL